MSYLEHHNLSSYLISLSSTTYPFYSSQMNLISTSLVVFSAQAEYFLSLSLPQLLETTILIPFLTQN